jgi:hypothetical protein
VRGDEGADLLGNVEDLDADPALVPGFTAGATARRFEERALPGWRPSEVSRSGGT